MAFDWDEAKAASNIAKHGVAFAEAKLAFSDPNRVVTEDINHSSPDEKRFYCYGKVEGRVMTVRFTIRAGFIRIIGAGYWRKGKSIYEKTR